MPKRNDPGESKLETRRRTAGKAANLSYSRRRGQIVKAAAVLFLEKGYQKTTLSDIAEAVHVDRATVYYYYKSKAEILRAAIGDTMDASLAELTRIQHLDSPAREKLRLWLKRLLEAFEEAHPYGSLYFQDDIWRSPDLDQAWVKKIRRQDAEIDQIVLGLIAQGQRDGSIRDDVEPTLLAKSCLGSVYWSYRWFKPDGRYTAAYLANVFDTVMFDGLDGDRRSAGSIVRGQKAPA